MACIFLITHDNCSQARVWNPFNYYWDILKHLQATRTSSDDDNDDDKCTWLRVQYSCTGAMYQTLWLTVAFLWQHCLYDHHQQQQAATTTNQQQQQHWVHSATIIVTWNRRRNRRGRRQRCLCGNCCLGNGLPGDTWMVGGGPSYHHPPAVFCQNLYCVINLLMKLTFYCDPEICIYCKHWDPVVSGRLLFCTNKYMPWNNLYVLFTSTYFCRYIVMTAWLSFLCKSNRPKTTTGTCSCIPLKSAWSASALF